MQVTRRTLLRSSLALGVAGESGLLGRLGRLAAATPPTEDYRALVCVFLFGGNDSNNMIVPMDSQRLKLYQNTRKNLTLPVTGTGALLPVQAASGLPLGLHPNMAEIQSLFNTRRLAVAANIGTLVKPVTRTDFLNGTTGLPANLFSHSDQQAEWQSSNAKGQSTTGWGGRLADALKYKNSGTFPTLVSVSGNNLFGVGQSSSPAAINPGKPLGLQGYTTSASQSRLNAVQELLTIDGGATLVHEANRILKQGIDNAAALSAAMNGAPALTTTFPANNRLGAAVAANRKNHSGSASAWLDAADLLCVNRQLRHTHKSADRSGKSADTAQPGVDGIPECDGRA